jgi:hypothetical protein
MYMLFEFAVPYPAEGLSRVMRERTHIGVAVQRRAGQGQPDCINGRLLHSNSQARGTAVSRPISHLGENARRPTVPCANGFVTRIYSESRTVSLARLIRLTRPQHDCNTKLTGQRCLPATFN